MKKLFLAFLAIGLLYACNNDDDGNNPDNPLLNGEWNLVTVSCLCEPINLQVGEHVWTFDVAENKLNVQNNVSENLHTIPNTGEYTITLTENTITFPEGSYDYYFENDKLYLADNPEVDGPLIEFVRE
nr:hypothetical protein [uncultured Psychroserpens sp.]